MHIYDIENENNREIFKNKNTKYKSNKINNMTPLEYRKNIGYTYIFRGYRINYSFNETIKSLFSWHNETINIWLHMIGFFIYTGFLIDSIKNDKYLETLVCIGSIIIFFCSSLFHLFNAYFCTLYSGNLNLCVDFLGIIIGVTLFEIVYTCLLYNNKSLIVLFTFLFILTNSIIFLIRFYYTINEKYISNRISVTVYLINSLVFLLCLSFSENNIFSNKSLLINFIISNSLLFFSIVFNLIKGYPERVCTHKLDYVGYSHQLWHIVIDYYLISLYYQVKNIT